MNLQSYKYKVNINLPGNMGWQLTVHHAVDLVPESITKLNSSLNITLLLSLLHVTS
jgi:hypothetical protein